MNSSPFGNADRNNRKRSLAKGSGHKWASRRLFLEALEPRQMMTIVPVEGTPFGGFDGNYYPPQHSEIASIDFLSAPAAGDPVAIAKGYLKANLNLYGLTVADVDRALVTNNYTDQKSGVSHVYFQQTYNGLPVADSHASVNLTKNGRVITAAANFVGGLSYPNGQLPLTTTINRGQALAAYAEQAGLTISGNLQLVSGPSGLNQKTVLRQAGISNDSFPMQLQYVGSPSGGLDLAWQITAQTPDKKHWFDAAVAASGPRAGQVIRVGDYVANASYEVFPLPLESPLEGGRSIVIDPQNFTASPFGWHDVNGIPGAEFQGTEGNNVRVQDDIDGNDTGGTQVNGGPTLDFRATFTTPAQPITNLQAGILQAFYIVNVAHDITFQYGFNEFAGNFQFKNYTAGLNQAFDFDPIIVDVQDSSAPNNAFMATLPDGFSSRMTIGISNIGKDPLTGAIIPINPARDTALDATVVLHEFFHGVSNRLTGGPSNALALQALQSGGLGEGWSDWFATVLTLKPTDNKTTALGQAEYFLPPVGDRQYPYSFDLSINPTRFSDFNAQADPSLPFPGNIPGNEVHNAGEIWASALIDMTLLLMERHGFDPNLYNGTGGNNLALQLVMDALKLQPPNPSFIEARDALIAADLALTDGDNYDLIWQAMARRGIGASANAGSDSTSVVVAEAFDLPPALARVEGFVFNDANGNARRDNGELPLSNWTVYVDANKNGILDAASEKQFQTGADGAYHFNFTTDQTVTIRQIVQANFTQTLPKNNAPITASVSRGNTIVADFGNRGLPGEIQGIKFSDTNGNGVRDVGEPGLQGVVIYVDLNNNGQLNVLEPSVYTNSTGRYSIKNLPAGTYSVREVLTPGLTQTAPGSQPGDIPGGQGYINVQLASNQILTGLDFGNIISLDFGDAPFTYGTFLANNGPRHGILNGFSLGATVDAEGDGQVSADASGDGADEDGVFDANGVSLANGTLIQGGAKQIGVATTTGINSPGKLHAWIDFNRNGAFEASEKVISNETVVGGVTRSFNIPIPATAVVGLTFARFRYGYEAELGPTGASQAGEVEDYAVTIVADFPTAVDDPSDPNDPAYTVRAGESSNLDVLANDPDTSNGAPHVASFTQPARNGTPTGSTVSLNPDGTILYTASALATEDESFTYRVSDVPDNSRLSNSAVVRINIIVSNPRVLPDTYTIAQGSSGDEPGSNAIRLGDPIGVSGRDKFFFINYPYVIENDKLPGGFANSMITFVETLTAVAQDGTLIPANTFQIYNKLGDPASQRTVTFTPPSASFTGTIIGRYTVDDNDPATNPGEGLITVQVGERPGHAGRNPSCPANCRGPAMRSPFSVRTIQGTILNMPMAA